MPDLLSRRLAELEGAESAVVLASGVAATASTLMALLRSGDHVLTSAWLRPETRRFFEHVLPALGVQVGFVDPRETRGWRRGLTKTTRALFVESPVLSSTRLVDLRPPRALSQELGLALIVDATAASPINFSPLQHGADVVIHDARLLLMGEGHGEAGVACGSESLMDEVRANMARWGSVPSPATCHALHAALHTLDVRVQRQNSNARALAAWAASAKAVTAVHWLGLPTHPDHALASELLRGFGATVLLDLTDDDAARRAAVVAFGDAEGGAAVDAFGSRLLPGDHASQLRVQVGVESADAALAWLATRLP